MGNPLNLKELFGKRYKIVLDEAALCPGESEDDPWYFQIPCKHGHIYPISDKFMGFYCEGTGIRAKLRQEHPEIDEIQSGDEESVFQFTVKQFETVVEYAKPKRRRILSEEHKGKLAESNVLN